MSVAGITTTSQYLTFRLGDEKFALDISQVREVLDFTIITKVPRTPEFMRGVINLRGGVVPVIDLRLKFDMSKIEKTVNTCIIIVEVNIKDETVALGVLADSVEEVIDLEPDQIDPPPRIGTRLKTEF
ncbi:MAG: chemotaxis protein CheW, partial [Deltaproteobacteria bacterium]|nr:chemotaxis protein CheW [Deltaproteobacteria bacterium]